MKHLTLKDLAQELGVSISTVSRAFQPDSEISVATRQRILQRAKALGFHPNPMAQRLHRQQTFQVGVVVPELTESFFGSVLQGMQTKLGPAGYQLLITQSGEDARRAEQHLRQLVANRVDGLLVSLTYDASNLSYLRQLHQQGMPLVLFNRVAADLPAPSVTFQDRKWAQFATEHLIQQGCRRILHLGGPSRLLLSQARRSGYSKALSKYHLVPLEPVETDFTASGSEALLTEWLRKGDPIDGIFAVNDPVALGAIWALQKQQLSVPDQVAVIGFSASPWGAWVTPSLSSVRQPTLQMGEEAANLLLAQLQGQGPPASICLEGELLLRDSSRRKG
jgi:DNA-binding LacI/PurR family transcriptional regulator